MVESGSLLVRAGCRQHLVGFGPETIPQAGDERGTDQHPRQRCRCGVVAGTDQRGDLVADLGIAEGTIGDQRLEDVERIARRVCPPMGDLVVDDRIECRTVGADASPSRTGKRVWNLVERRRLEILLRPLEEVADLVASLAHALAEQRPHHDPQDE